MDSILKKIFKKSTRIKGNRKLNISLYSKLPSQQVIDFDKNTLLFDLMRNHSDLIRTTKHYPKDDVQHISLDADFILIKTDDLKAILKGVNVEDLKLLDNE